MNSRQRDVGAEVHDDRSATTRGKRRGNDAGRAVGEPTPHQDAANLGLDRQLREPAVVAAKGRRLRHDPSRQSRV